MTGQRLATNVRKARRESQCPVCRRWIRTGQQIARLCGIWMCVRCALDHQHETSTEE